MPGGLDFEFRFNKPGAAPGGDGPKMRILVLGDFRGAREGGAGLSAARLHRVDVDNFDAVMGKIGPRLSLEIEGGSVDLEFSEVEDFEPDALWRRLSVFAHLRDLRKRLSDPATFAAAAAELGAKADPAPPPPDAAESDDDSLERLLGQKPARAGGGTGDAAGFIRSIVAPYIVPDPDPRQDRLLASVDEAASGLMRLLLRHPRFRALEAAWRSLFTLVTSVETDETLSLHVLDASRAELEADLNAAGGELDRWALHKLVVETSVLSPGGEPWSLLAGDYTFGPDTADMALLGALGVLAARAGGPFVAAAAPSLLGLSALADPVEPAEWPELEERTALRYRAMRAAPMAPSIGLALPRVLLRLPYGPGGESVDAFEFDELGPERDHEGYLWGNPAFGIARLLARSFTERGGAMEPGDHRELEGLPLHTGVDADGEKTTKPCAEVWLSERTAEAILARGIMPLMSVKNSDSARFLRIQSIAEPPRPLRGFWS